MIRSALNRFFDDNQRGRPLKGTDVATMVTNYRGLMVAKKKAASARRGRITRSLPGIIFSGALLSILLTVIKWGNN